MSPAQLMKHFESNKSLISRELGCTRGTIGNWVRAKRIPIPWQFLIEKKTDGQLKAG